jgi:hypothetical protein
MQEVLMRTLIAATLFAALSGVALAQSEEFYVVQNTETRACSIETDYPSDVTAQVVIANKFTDRADAEDAMRMLRGCN